MKISWKSFMFSLGVLLFALISVNLISSGVKLEGFQEGATDPKADAKSKCQKHMGVVKLKINDFENDLKKLNDSNTLYKGNNVDYAKLTKYGKAGVLGGACNQHVLFVHPPKQAQPVAAAKPAPAPAPVAKASPAPVAKPAPAPPARPAARRR
jgi:hypothetical protein